MFKLWFPILMLSAPAPVYSAEPETYFEIDGWSVFKNEDHCSAIVGYERGKTLWISFDYGLENTSIYFGDPAFKSVKKDAKYKLNLTFLKSGKLDEGWGEVNATGAVTDKENGLFVELKGNEALSDIATSDTISLFRGDIVVISLNLLHSSQVVDQLRKCAREVWLVNPSDPLAGAAER